MSIDASTSASTPFNPEDYAFSEGLEFEFYVGSSVYDEQQHAMFTQAIQEIDASLAQMGQTGSAERLRSIRAKLSGRTEPTSPPESVAGQAAIREKRRETLENDRSRLHSQRVMFEIMRGNDVEAAGYLGTYRTDTGEVRHRNVTNLDDKINIFRIALEYGGANTLAHLSDIRQEAEASPDVNHLIAYVCEEVRAGYNLFANIDSLKKLAQHSHANSYHWTFSLPEALSDAAVRFLHQKNQQGYANILGYAEEYSIELRPVVQQAQLFATLADKGEWLEDDYLRSVNSRVRRRYEKMVLRQKVSTLLFHHAPEQAKELAGESGTAQSALAARTVQYFMSPREQSVAIRDLLANEQFVLLPDILSASQKPSSPQTRFYKLFMPDIYGQITQRYTEALCKSYSDFLSSGRVRKDGYERLSYDPEAGVVISWDNNYTTHEKDPHWLLRRAQLLATHREGEVDPDQTTLAALYADADLLSAERANFVHNVFKNGDILDRVDEIHFQVTFNRRLEELFVRASSLNQPVSAFHAMTYILNLQMEHDPSSEDSQYFDMQVQLMNTAAVCLGNNIAQASMQPGEIGQVLAHNCKPALRALSAYFNSHDISNDPKAIERALSGKRIDAASLALASILPK